MKARMSQGYIAGPLSPEDFDEQRLEQINNLDKIENAGEGYQEEKEVISRL
jgi:hypothetical protein